MKPFLFALFSFFALALGARAQQFDNPTLVPVSYWGRGVLIGLPGSFSFGSSLGTSTGASGSGAGGTYLDSGVVTGWVTPGKEYNVTVTSSGLATVLARFIEANGCEVYLNGIRRTTYSAGTNYTFTLRVEKIRDLPQGNAGRRGGDCTSFPEDKPIWYVGLGTLRTGQFAGSVGFRADTITSALYTTAALIYDSVDTGEVSVTRSGGAITQIDSRDVTLKMTTLSGTSYKIDVYARGGSVPFITYTIDSYAGGSGIRIDKVEDSVTWSTALQKVGSTWTRYDWQRFAAFPYANITTTSVSGSTSTVTHGSGTGSTSEVKTYTTVNSKTELASVQWGSASATSYDYYSSASGTGWPQALKSVVEPTGRWTLYDYFNGAGDTRDGKVWRIYRPWLDAPTSPSGANTGNCHLETYDYTTNYDGMTTAPASRLVTIAGTNAGKTTWAYNWGYATVNSHTMAQIVQQDYSSASSYLTTTTLAYRGDDSSFFRGKPHAVTHPDGTKEAYGYYFGTWNAGSSTFTTGTSGDDRRILTFHGQATSGSGGATAVSSWDSWTLDTLYLVANLSTIEETVIDVNGRVVFNATHIYTGGSSMERIRAMAYTYNDHNLLTTEKDLIRSVSGGDVAVSHTYDAGLETGRTDVDGSQTHWTYDNTLRNDALTTAYGGSGSYPARTQNFTYFSSGLANTAQKTPGVTTTYGYDAAGRVTSSSDPKPGGGTLTTTYSYPSGVQTTATLPTNATQTTDLYLDGRLKSQTGSAQVDTRYDYALEGGGTGNVLKTTKHGASTANGWAEVKTDWLGRTVTVRAPEVTWSSGSNKVVRKTFSYSGSTGQLTSVSTVDESAGSARILPDHLYLYGNLGLMTKEGDDIGANGALDDNSADRILTHSVSFWKDSGGYNGWIRDDLTQALRTLSNPSDTATVSWTRTRLTQFNGGVLLGGTDRVLADVVTLDASGRSTADWDWSNSSARTRTHYRSISGVGQSALTTWQDGYLKSEQSITGVTKTYTYNGQGLVANNTESTTNAATSYNYHSGTAYLSSVVQTTGASSTATTNYGYSWNGSSNSTTVTTTDAASNVAYTEFDAKGLPVHSWGSAAQPMRNIYDSYGRKIEMLTWQSGSFGGSTWPNPAGGNRTQWTIDAATGAVTSKIFPNGSHVDFAYNARGQLTTRTWARGVTTNYYYFDSAGSQTGELQSVGYSDGTQGVSYTYNRVGAPLTVADAAGTRTFAYRSDLQVSTETLGTFYNSRVLTPAYDGYGRSTGFSFNGSATVSATIGYDGSSGRPNSVAGALGGTSTTFSLGYATGTDWVNSVTSGSYSRSTPLASRYDVLSSATTSWGGTTLGQFTATYTDPRGWRTTQAIAAGGAGTYANALGIGSGLTTTFAFDAYGQLASSTGSVGTRTFSWTYDLAGNRATDTANGSGTTYTPDSLNRYSSITGNFGESGISYDADGNLTQDAIWTYAYDGENRLKSMTKSGQTLTFMYDYAGRRIGKTVNGTTTTFLWSGWQLAAQMDSSGYTPQKVFVWGRDFSDAQGSAGGAGALLAQLDGNGVNYAMPDAFGNIVGYLNSSGTLVAATEYSAYGRALGTSGSVADYPIGYSGQFADAETGLVYYGLRYYSPKHGRFVNRDPIEEAGGNNLYGFVGNSPVRGWDTLGMYTEAERAALNAWYKARYDNSHDAGTYSDPWLQGGASSWEPYHGMYTGAKGEDTWVNPNATGSSGLVDQYFARPAQNQADYVNRAHDAYVAQNGENAPNNAGGVSALTNAKLSNGIYDKNFTGADGYTMVPGSLVDDSKTGLRTAVFSNGTNNVQVFAGTSPSSWANWVANLKQALGFKSPQYEQGMQSARDNYKLYGGNLSFTGHSLGGGIASASAIVTGGSAVTFNAAGVHNNTIGDFSRSNGSVTSYYSTFDVLHVLNWITPSSASVPGQRISLGAAGLHGMGSMVNALGGGGP